jgi:hypothetical protein
MAKEQGTVVDKDRRSEYHQPIAMKKPTSTKRPDGVLTCTTCGWYKARLEGATPAHYCLHPVNVSVVCGSSKGAYDARKPDGFCGPDADCHTSKVNVDSAAFNRH